ncbi:energy-coupling factor ABC transporter ATP-binding protein [Gorillibacterium timonense]|uniref:energy-coupling factor ABC transporter ATP-binding protein n=1 Tax=Gorillibacterium timonense TaxID=1689269 RepID=UPI00071DF5DB|nr:ABC transporter ATP-binding protein [Gorillibacterium timonense]
MKDPNPLLLNKASVAFRNGTGIQLALDGVNLQLVPGEFVALIGTNGSGKSTLLKVLAGLLPLSSGELDFGWSKACRKAIVLQNPEAQLLGETVEEDLRFSLEQADVPADCREAKLMNLLRQCGLTGLEKQPLRSLSSGQKQLAAIAGGLALDARLLLFDEVTAYLDPLEAKRVLHLASALCAEGRTVVWSTQNPVEAVEAKRVISLRGGAVNDDGTAVDFFYGRNGVESASEQLGLQAPHPVLLALALADRGIYLTPPPLTVDAFMERLAEWKSGRKNGRES